MRLGFIPTLGVLSYSSVEVKGCAARTGGGQMGEGDTTPLAQMEQAAQASSDPQHIKEAHTIKRHPASHADKLWLATLGIIVALLLGAHFFLNWKSDFMGESTLLRVRNYIRGAALVAGILLLARLLEVFAIGFVR
ncbi:MAG TPA: hypothetical protein VGF13_09465, partial [Verrucomicrobiae bacterium]